MTEYLLDHQWMFIRHIPVPNLRTAFVVQIGFLADLTMLAITLTAPSIVGYGGRLCENSNPPTVRKDGVGDDNEGSKYGGLYVRFGGIADIRLK